MKTPARKKPVAKRPFAKSASRKKKKAVNLIPDKELRILFNAAGSPKFVVEKNKKHSGMTVVLDPGDVIEWSNRYGIDFEVGFVGPNGNSVVSPFSDWGGASSKSSVNGVLSGRVAATPPDVVYKYNVHGPAWPDLDPEIIIER